LRPGFAFRIYIPDLHPHLSLDPRVKQQQE
jgi:hypothetical protein